ncbi:MAG: flippase [Nitrospirae bacterium]|nr:flippase [Nitrospirota bacterium]
MNKETASAYHSDLSKIAKNAGISGIGEIVFNILGYVTSIAMTRTVGPSIFGVFNLANIITWIAQIFSSAGLNEGLLRFVAFYKGKDDNQRLKGAIVFGTKITFSLSLALTLIIFFCADYMAEQFFHDKSLGLAIKILIISLPFLTLGELWLKVIQSFQVIKYQVYIQKFYQPMIKLTAMVVLFLIGLKLGGILAASVISILAGFIFSFYYLIKIFPVYKRLPVPIYEKKELMAFSLPMSLTQLMGVVTFYIDSLMLGYFKTPVEVGVYSAVVRVAILVLLPMTSFNSIFAPMISESYSKGETTKLENLFKTTTKWTFILSFPLFLLFVLFAESIMKIFGEGFAVGAAALIILGTGELINSGVGSVGYMLMMTGKAKIVLFNSLVFLSMNVILNYLLIPRYGVVGAAAATGSSIAFVNILRLIEVYFVLKMHPFKLNFLKPCAAGLLSFLLVFFVSKNIQEISLLVMMVLSLLFAGSYSLFIYVLKLEEDDEYILKLFYQKMVHFKEGLLHAR